jgi:LacI family transcriptional regulator
MVELVRQSASRSVDAVLIDDIHAGIQGTQHLLDLGHQRIAVITGPASLSTSQQRLEGYRQSLEKAALPLDETLIHSGPYRREAAYAATLALLKREYRPTALIATSNELVVGVLQALAECRIRIPADLSVVGFGNPDWFALLQPALTTVALPIKEMAMIAAQTLLARIREQALEADAPKEEKAPIISRYQAHLVVRASTWPPDHREQENNLS